MVEQNTKMYGRFYNLGKFKFRTNRNIFAEIQDCQLYV